MTQPIKSAYVFVGYMIIFLVIILVVWSIIYSVREYRQGALVFTGLIKKQSPLIGGALEFLVKTFLWF